LRKISGDERKADIFCGKFNEMKYGGFNALVTLSRLVEIGTCGHSQLKRKEMGNGWDIAITPLSTLHSM
jgi:hypothetical protein